MPAIEGSVRARCKGCCCCGHAWGRWRLQNGVHVRQVGQLPPRRLRDPRSCMAYLACRPPAGTCRCAFQCRNAGAQGRLRGRHVIPLATQAVARPMLCILGSLIESCVFCQANDTSRNAVYVCMYIRGEVSSLVGMHVLPIMHAYP